MTKWYDKNVQKCSKWTIHEGSSINGAECAESNTMLIYSSSKILLGMAKKDIKDHDPSMVGREYVGQDNWIVVSERKSLQKVMKIKEGSTIEVFG